MSDKQEALVNWVNERLSSLLDFPVPENLTQYIVSIEDPRDLDEYLRSLLDFKNKNHQQFRTELIQKRQAGYVKKGDQENIFVHPKVDKKSSKSKTQTDEDETKETGMDKKKKPNFVNLYSPEGLTKDVILLKGRHRCDCQASKHRLINNCLSCGRIVCEQEGSGACLVCNSLVCSREEQQVLLANTKRSNELYQKLADKKKPQGWEAALQQRNRLLEYDRTSQSRTQVIDDESDYYATNSVWLSKEERDKLKQREDEVRSKRHASRLDRKLTFDFAGRQVVEEADNLNDLYPEDDSVLREISQSINKSSGSAINDSNIHPGIMCAQPIFQTTASKSKSSGNKSVKKETEKTHNRVQDRQFLEMCDEGFCLSMHQPWASLLVSGIKIHEGRTWYSSHRGRLWIAAASKVANPIEILEAEQIYKTLLNDEDIRFPAHYSTSCLLGCVNVIDVLPQEEYRTKYPDGESVSPFVFICDDPQELPIHFPVQGQHKIYKMDPKVHHAAQKSLLRVAQLQAERALNH